MRLGGRPVMSSPLKTMRPAVGRMHAGEAVEERALAGAVRADDGADLAARDLEVDVVERGQTAEADGQALGAQARVVGGAVLRPSLQAGRGARRWPRRPWSRRPLQANLQAGGKDRLLLGDHLDDAVLAVLDVEDELAQERLVVLLAQHLVALREVVAFLHLQAFEGLDQLHRVGAALELRLLHADLEGVHGLVVRLHVAVGQRTRTGRSAFSRFTASSKNFLCARRIERRVEHRDVAVDADEAFDLVAERRQVGRLGDGAVAGPLVLLGHAEVEGLVADRHAVLAEEDAEEAVEVAGDLGEERRHVGGAERDAGGADDLAAGLLDLARRRRRLVDWPHE